MPSKHSLTSFVRGSGAPLLWRVFGFLAFFIVVSGLLGPRIISSGQLYTYHFDVYAEAGKPLLFAVIAFVLLARRKPFVALPKWNRLNIVWLAGAVALAVLAGISSVKLIDGAHGHWLLLTHLSLVLSMLAGLLGCFGLASLRTIYGNYKRELLIALALGAAFYVFLLAVYALWKVLAAGVLYAVAGLLHLAGLNVSIVLPRYLVLDKFGIEIAQYCSGIESIALFSGLYVLVGLLDWERFNLRRFFAIFPLALIVLFGFNILRVFGLIMAAFYINADLAFSLFHTYAGMVFFIIYSGIFWKLAYKWMLKPSPAS